MTYAVGDTQYVAVLNGPPAIYSRPGSRAGPGRLLVFALGGRQPCRRPSRHRDRFPCRRPPGVLECRHRRGWRAVQLLLQSLPQLHVEPREGWRCARFATDHRGDARDVRSNRPRRGAQRARHAIVRQGPNPSQVRLIQAYVVDQALRVAPAERPSVAIDHSSKAPLQPPEAIVFAGDGQMISQWGGLLEAADVPSTMIVGAHRGVRCFGGWGAALAIGLRHPDLYGAIFSGLARRWLLGRLTCCRFPLPRTYLVAGQRPPSALVGKWKSSAVVDNYANSVVHVRWNRFSSTTRPSGRPRCAVSVRFHPSATLPGRAANGSGLSNGPETDRVW